MWDLIVSILDHCLSFYFIKGRYIGEKIHLMQKTIENLENENSPSY